MVRCAHLKEQDISGGICARCFTYLCNACATEYHISPLPNTHNIESLPESLLNILKTEGILSGRYIIFLCPLCLESIENTFLESTPYEKLPLLINYPWKSSDILQKYKDRLSLKL